jgi:hypothetical protein
MKIAKERDINHLGFKDYKPHALQKNNNNNNFIRNN